MLRTCICGDDPIENTRVSITIELDENLFFGGYFARPYIPAKGCLALSLPASMVSALGSPFMALAMACFVAS